MIIKSILYKQMSSRSATNRGGERGLEKTTKQWKKDMKKTKKQKLEFNDKDNYIIIRVLSITCSPGI